MVVGRSLNVLVYFSPQKYNLKITHNSVRLVATGHYIQPTAITNFALTYALRPKFSMPTFCLISQTVQNIWRIGWVQFAEIQSKETCEKWTECGRHDRSWKTIFKFLYWNHIIFLRFVMEKIQTMIYDDV